MCSWLFGNRERPIIRTYFRVFITTSLLVSTSISLHAPLILKKCPFLLEEILCNWLLGNRESPIISTYFPCFHHNFTSCININSFACTINIEKNVNFYLKKYFAIGSWEIKKILLLALDFHVFITTSRLASTSIALHAPLILIKCPFLFEKNMQNKCY